MKDMGLEIEEVKLDRFWDMLEGFVWKEEKERLEEVVGVLKGVK